VPRSPSARRTPSARRPGADRAEAQPGSACTPSALLVGGPGPLADAVAEVAASVGCPLVVLGPEAPGPSLRETWDAAACVVVTSAAAPAVGALIEGGRLPRRHQVLLADEGAAPDFAAAVAAGAEHVVALPEGGDWLAARLADAASPLAGLGRVVGVIGGRGGAGATTLAAVLASRAAFAGWRAAVIDADPLGGGADLALGAELAEGLRWRALADAHGPIAAESLAEALPAVEGVSVLAHERGPGAPAVGPGAMRAVVGSAARAYDLVLVDLPRALDAAAEEAAVRADEVLVVVPAEVRATASAAQVAERLEGLCRVVSLVAVLPSPSGLDEEHLADALGLPVAAAFRREASVSEAVERGDAASLRRGSLVRAADRLLSRWCVAA
jgi:secretion/DNA translocation related CpaE-like protein